MASLPDGSLKPIESTITEIKSIIMILSTNSTRSDEPFFRPVVLKPKDALSESSSSASEDEIDKSIIHFSKLIIDKDEKTGDDSHRNERSDVDGCKNERLDLDSCRNEKYDVDSHRNKRHDVDRNERHAYFLRYKDRGRSYSNRDNVPRSYDRNNGYRQRPNHRKNNNKSKKSFNNFNREDISPWIGGYPHSAPTVSTVLFQQPLMPPRPVLQQQPSSRSVKPGILGDAPYPLISAVQFSTYQQNTVGNPSYCYNPMPVKQQNTRGNPSYHHDPMPVEQQNTRCNPSYHDPMSIEPQNSRGNPNYHHDPMPIEQQNTRGNPNYHHDPMPIEQQNTRGNPNYHHDPMPIEQQNSRGNPNYPHDPIPIEQQNIRGNPNYHHDPMPIEQQNSRGNPNYHLDPMPIKQQNTRGNPSYQDSIPVEQKNTRGNPNYPHDPMPIEHQNNRANPSYHDPMSVEQQITGQKVTKFHKTNRRRPFDRPVVNPNSEPIDCAPSNDVPNQNVSFERSYYEPYANFNDDDAHNNEFWEDEAGWENHDNSYPEPAHPNSMRQTKQDSNRKYFRRPVGRHRRYRGRWHQSQHKNQRRGHEWRPMNYKNGFLPNS